MNPNLAILPESVVTRALELSPDLPRDPARWSDPELTSAWCLSMERPLVSIHPGAIDRSTFERHRDECLSNAWLPTFFGGGIACVATPRPWDPQVLRSIRKALRSEIHVFGASDRDFARTCGLLEGPVLEATSRTKVRASIPTSWRPEAASRDEIGKVLLVSIIRAAWTCGASDLFLNDVGESVQVSARISGVVEVFPPVPPRYRQDVMVALRSMAGIPVTERTQPVDANLECLVAPDYVINVRIAIAPMRGGETATLRILDARKHASMVARLPFREPLLGRVNQALRAKRGLVLVTGPTGSGKTTTLYSCLSQFDRSDLVVRSAEDPVEYPIEGVTQIPVGGNTGRTFASALKFFLRSAPNVLLVGEIRDGETAALCIEAALTGHLVLSTLHTNDCPGTISRLLALGVPLANAASTVSLVIAQRLLPRLCPVCRQEREPAPDELAAFESYKLPRPTVLYSRRGCGQCGFVGVSGLVPVFEGLDEEVIRSIPLQDWNEAALRREWLRRGGRCLSQEALEAAAAGTVEGWEAMCHYRTPD